MFIYVYYALATGYTLDREEYSGDFGMRILLIPPIGTLRSYCLPVYDKRGDPASEGNSNVIESYIAAKANSSRLSEARERNYRTRISPRTCTCREDDHPYILCSVSNAGGGGREEYSDEVCDKNSVDTSDDATLSQVGLYS